MHQRVMLKYPETSVGTSALPNGRILGKETSAGRDRRDTLTQGCGSKNSFCFFQTSER